MFNLLKMKWHQSNVFTSNDALEILCTVDNVTTIDASNIHIDYATIFNQWYKQHVSGSIQKNHLFSFSIDTIKDCVMITKSYFNTAVTSTQSIKKVDKMFLITYQNLTSCMHNWSFCLNLGCNPSSSFTKWRSVAPHPYKYILSLLPPNDVFWMLLKKGRKEERKKEEEEYRHIY